MNLLKKCDAKNRLSAIRDKSRPSFRPVSEADRANHSEIKPDRPWAGRLTFVEDFMLEHSLHGLHITSIEICRHFLNSYRISATVGPAERRRGVRMDCPICRDLERAYEAGLSEYIEARSSACFRVCTKLAAQKNVEMERARYELEEHRLLCVSAVRLGFLRFVVRLHQLVDKRLHHIRRDASVPLDQRARVEHRFSRV